MKLQVIIGATRQGRVSDRVANWVKQEAEQLPDTTVEILDLRELDLPFFDEATPPQYNPNRTPDPKVKVWLDKLAEGEAYVVVTPEYNRAVPGVLLNAFDYPAFEMQNKPTAIVAHGSTGGAQAVASLRGVLSGIKTFSTPTPTYISAKVDALIDESGTVLDEEIKQNPYGPHAALQATLTELKWYADALTPACAKS